MGLRELRQQASELIRRAESGEEITVTVGGRPSARLVAAAPRQWRRWDEISALFEGPSDPAWEHDRELVDREIRDPWTQA